MPTAESSSRRGSRRRVDAFARRRLDAARVAHGLSAPVERANALLLDAALAPPAGAPVRAPSLAADGTPVAFSIKVARGTAPPPYRVVVEPGGTATAIPEQVDAARAVARQALALLGWQDAAEPLDAAIEELLPADRDAMRGWWGGLWLGLSAAGPDAVLRVYANLRNGDVGSRWRRAERLAAAIGAHGLDGARARAAPHGQPTGACLAVTDGRVAGMRLYVALALPSRAAVADACPPAFAGDAAASFWSGFVTAFGPPPRQGASVAYDLVAGGTLARVKLELCCEELEAQANRSALAWLAGHARRSGLDGTQLEAFADDLVASFGAARTQYVTVGLRGGVEHVTAYCQPANARAA